MDANYPSLNVSMHILVLVCNFWGCTIHHVLCFRTKLWNYINYSSIKWCIVILLNNNVCHLSIPYSWRKSMHSKVVVLTQLKIKWDVVLLTLFGAKCDCLIGWSILTSEIVLYISHLFVGRFVLSIILLLYWVCNVSKLHAHWVLLFHIQLNLYSSLEMIDQCIYTSFSIRAWPSCLQKL